MPDMEMNEDNELVFGKTIICGSPRDDGRCMAFAEGLFEEAIANEPDAEHALISVADMDIEGCFGCNGCKESNECVIDDDMLDVLYYVKHTNEIQIVSPIYMAGVPSQFKALLDRLQPLFWTDARHAKLKRAEVHLFGDGHDPFGAEGAINSIKSALLVAGFEVAEVELHVN